MGELGWPETAPLFLISLSGLAIGLFVLIKGLDRWTDRFADLMVRRSERRRAKEMTKPTLDGEYGVNSDEKSA
jgi:hypothetical protein